MATWTRILLMERFNERMRIPPIRNLGLYFVYLLIADWNFLTNFCSSGPSFNRTILTFLCLKSEASAHVQIRNYSFIRTTCKFRDMESAGNLH